MRKSRKIIISIFAIVVLSFSLVSCSSEGKAKELFTSYKDKWIAKDYKGMYQLLSANSKNKISEEEFIKRYTNIFDGISASNLAFEIEGDISKEDDNFQIPFKGSMDTVAGKLEENTYKMKVVKEEDGYKVDWSENLILPMMQEGDKVRVNTLRGNRGKILDRDGKVLAEDGKLYTVGIHPAKLDPAKKDNIISELAKILDISKETITKKLDANSDPNYFVPIVDVIATDSKVDELNKMNSPGIILREKIGRVYINSNAFGRVLGYVGPITKEELDKNKDKGYTSTSLIGKAGVEQVYEDSLKGKNGGEISIDRNGTLTSILKTNPQNGKDIKLTIDKGVQESAYKELNGDKGAATAVDPKTGEILALVSAPSYNSNTFTTYLTKTEKEKNEKDNNASSVNRFNKVYSPGSTMKLITASIGLNDGVIKPNEGVDIKGLEWQKDSSWGGYKVTRVKDPGKPVNLYDAVKYSDNIYFAQAAINIGGEKFIEGAKNFGIGDKLNAGYPMEDSKISNNGKFDNEILLGDTGYGQGQVMVTPLNLALAYSALGNDGNIMQPKLVKDDKAASIWKKEAIKKDNVKPLIDAFEGVINDSEGTGHAAKINGVSLAGKTGTAEIKKTQDDKNGTENGWFVAVNTDKPKIAISMIVEDVKDKGGSHYVVPKVKNVIEDYLK